MNPSLGLCCRRALGLLALGFSFPGANAAETVAMPASACHASAVRLLDGFEAVPREPINASMGSGGVAGSFSRALAVPGISGGNQTWYGYAPAAVGERPLPVLLVLHGAAGSHAAAMTQAQQLRDLWAVPAESYGFVVVAPVSSGASGGWIAPAGPMDHPTDYDVIVAAMADAEGAYDINIARRHGWGFSAGGHVMHDLALNGFAPAFSEATMAGYGVNSGLLAGLACVGLSSPQCSSLLTDLTRKLPTAIRIGLSDPYLPNAQQDRNRFIASGWMVGVTLDYVEFSGGHEVVPAQLEPVWTFLCRYASTP